MVSVEGNAESEPRRRPPYFWNYAIAGALHIAPVVHRIVSDFLLVSLHLSSLGSLGFVLLDLLQSVVWALLGVGVLLRRRWAAVAVIALLFLGFVVFGPIIMPRAWISATPPWDSRGSLLLVAALAEIWFLTAPTFRARWKVGLLLPAAATLGCLWTAVVYVQGTRIARQEVEPIAQRIFTAWFDPSAGAKIDAPGMTFRPVVHGSIGIRVASGFWCFPVRRGPDGTWSFSDIRSTPPDFSPYPVAKPLSSGPNEGTVAPEMTQAQLRDLLLAAGLKPEIAETARSLAGVPRGARGGMAGTASLPAGAGQLRVLDEGDIAVMLSTETIP